MRLGNFTAHILVDDKPLEEYDVVTESPTKMTCWIASQEGKSFRVEWKCHEKRRATPSQGRVYVDGIACGRVLMPSGVLDVCDTASLSHLVNITTERELMFTRIQLSDDDALLNKQIHKNLGEVHLNVERGEYAVERRQYQANQVAISNNGTLHERSKKATVHCVGFGQERVRDPKVVSLLHKFSRNLEPEITFIFKYQPLSVLQANGVAPKPTLADAGSGPRNTSGEHDVGTSRGTTPEDIKTAQLNDRIQGLENELKRLRDLQADDSKRKSKRIKTEGPREQKPLFVGEVIDLT